MRLRGICIYPAIVFFMMGATASACNEPYPPSMVKAFMAHCAKDTRLNGYCGCVMGTIEKTIPLTEFIEIGASHPGGINTDNRYIAANQTCEKQFPLPDDVHN